MSTALDPDPEATYARVRTFADKLSEALEDLDDVGGLPALPARRSTLDRAARDLRALVAQLQEQLAAYDRIKRGPVRLNLPRSHAR